MINLSPRLKTVALTGQERWRYFSQGLICYPITVNTAKKAASPRTPRRHAGPQTKAVLKVADERETFTIDDLPPFDRRHLASLCQHLVKKGELRRIQAGTPGRKGMAAVYSRSENKRFSAA